MLIVPRLRNLSEDDCRLFQSNLDIVKEKDSPLYASRQNYNSNDIFSSVLIAVPFVIAKTQKQPKCPSTDEWIKMW